MYWTLGGAGPKYVGFHFGMTGQWVIEGAKPPPYKSQGASAGAAAFPPRFCKLLVRMEDGTRLAFCDPRRLARVVVAAAAPPVDGLGPDALLELPAAAVLAAMLGGRATPIKKLLLDQAFLAGVGNWIADEVLYQCETTLYKPVLQPPSTLSPVNP